MRVVTAGDFDTISRIDVCSVRGIPGCPVAGFLPRRSPLSLRAAPYAEAVQLDLNAKKAPKHASFSRSTSMSSASPRAKAKRPARHGHVVGFLKATARRRWNTKHWSSLTGRLRRRTTLGNALSIRGETADEAARVCIDSGDLDSAAEWYRKGYDLGLKEPGISPDRKALWEFRWEHAQARIAARRGKRPEAEQHIAAAQAALGRMTQLRPQQESFFPYLTGYVAFYLGDYAKALEDLHQANQNDPFIQCLLGQAYEKLGQKENAMECYRKAAATTAHNPPAALARPFARRKLS